MPAQRDHDHGDSDAHAEREAAARQARRKANGHDYGDHAHFNGKAHTSMALLREGSDMTMKPIEWLWPGWLPKGKLILLAGQPGAGKTTITLSLAAALTRGTMWPDGSEIQRAGHVAMWTSEDDAEDTVVPRLSRMGANLNHFHHIYGARRPDGRTDIFDPATDIPLLAEALAAAPYHVDMLIIDPIVSAVAGDAHKANDVRRHLEPLIQFGASYGCAIVGITHFAKRSQGTLPTERVLGSQAFVAAARMVLLAAYDEKSRSGALMRAKSNITRAIGGIAYSTQEGEAAPGIDATYIEWGAYQPDMAVEMLADLESTDEGGALSEAVAFLHALLEDGPQSQRYIKAQAHEAGHSWRTIERAKHKLKVQAERVQDGTKAVWKWALP
ncbi:AAA family ATPase [Cupriavidus sp. D384]|uniref:AAA family ATPase n=1 Tax=Cupriavidus sp. D384 TaxID=1538095 RepID=UPI000832B17A|nr:AAA family ATPase [Cupriavidus sp. D384]